MHGSMFQIPPYVFLALCLVKHTENLASLRLSFEIIFVKQQRTCDKTKLLMHKYNEHHFLSLSLSPPVSLLPAPTNVQPSWRSLQCCQLTRRYANCFSMLQVVLKTYSQF